jgi:hypothetical protein
MRVRLTPAFAAKATVEADFHVQRIAEGQVLATPWCEVGQGGR